MHDNIFLDPDLTIALALVFGLMAQVLATHLRIPGIVLLLASGVLLGPDVLGVVQPSTLGASLPALVGIAVAVILFEGGMNLDFPRLKRAGGPIRNLVTVGALVTAVGATLTVRMVMDWTWSLSLLFGTLVIVTGPTVVTPLLKRLKVHKRVGTILEAEGVLIDPIGAIIAFVALELVLHPTAGTFALSIPDLIVRLTVGTIFGIASGWSLSYILRIKHLIPEGLTNVFTLSFVLATFEISEALLHESGIAAVTVAGVAVRYLGTPVQRELIEFKEQLTVMLIGMLFVLLAADVRLADIQALGMGGLITVAVLMFVVRPLTVIASTWGSTLDWKEKLFLAWMGPRGIVAAAVASLFTVALDEAGIPGGTELRALVFLVIAITVVSAGFTGGIVAWALGLRRPQNAGWVILGAHQLARTVGRALQESDEEVLLVDVNPANCALAEAEGLPILHGDALKESVMGRMELDTRAGALAITRNEEINFLFAQKARQEGKVPRVWCTLQDDKIGVNRQMLSHKHVHLLFGREQDVDRWNNRLANGQAEVVRRKYTPSPDRPDALGQLDGHARVAPILVRRGRQVILVDEETRYRKGDELLVLVADTARGESEQALVAAGWRTPTGNTRPDPREAGISNPDRLEAR